MMADLIGTPGDPGPAREALHTLQYLIRNFDDYGSLDEINMRHAREAASSLRVAILAADKARLFRLEPKGD